MPSIPDTPLPAPLHLLPRDDPQSFPSPKHIDPSPLLRRQSDGDGFVAIPSVYDTRGPPPGTVVAVVLGSVCGFVLLLFLLFHVGNISARSSVVAEEHIVRTDRPRSHRSRRSRRSHSHGARTAEIREVSRSPRRIIVEDRRSRRGSMPPPPPGPPPMRIVEERFERGRRVDGDDIVEVIEEHSDFSPPRRHRSRRGSEYRY